MMVSGFRAVGRPAERPDGVVLAGIRVVELQYEPSTAARPVVVEQDAGLTRIIVPMPGPYVPVPQWVLDLDVLALLISPIWWGASLVIRLCRRSPKPPRAVFEVSGEQLKLILRDAASGETSTFEWPRVAVVEARANRYESGLWINVSGHVKETYLADLPRQTIERLEVALEVALRAALSSDASQIPATRDGSEKGTAVELKQLR